MYFLPNKHCILLILKALLNNLWRRVYCRTLSIQYVSRQICVRVYVKNQITCHLYRSTVSGKCRSHIWTLVVHTVVKEHTLHLLHKHLLYMQLRLQQSVDKVSIKTLKATQELNLRITEDPIYTNLFLGHVLQIIQMCIYMFFKKASKWSL